MLKLLPILLLIAYCAAVWFFSAWRLKQDLTRKSTPLDHPRLVPMLARLGEALDLPPIRAHVYHVEAINGLAAPDGRIFLTAGFLRKLDADEVTAEELASVIAHELGHVAHGHARRRMLDFAGQNVIRTVLGGTLGRFVPGIGPWIANMVANMVAAGLSRNDEYQADAYAAALMTKAGFGTGPQTDLLARFEHLAAGGAPGAKGDAAPRAGIAWLASHPPTHRRIAAIRALDARWHRA